MAEKSWRELRERGVAASAVGRGLAVPRPGSRVKERRVKRNFVRELCIVGLRLEGGLVIALNFRREGLLVWK